MIKEVKNQLIKRVSTSYTPCSVINIIAHNTQLCRAYVDVKFEYNLIESPSRCTLLIILLNGSRAGLEILRGGRVT